MTLPRFGKPAACAGCALATSGFGYAGYVGPETARVRFIAEALGGEEAIRGEPLVGAAGGVHSRVLHRAGVVREHCGHDNTVRCQPPGNWLEGAPWEHAAIAHCRQYLNQTLATVPDNGVVVTLGGTPLRSILGLHGVDGVAVKDFHGTVTRDPSDRFWVVPTFHPSHLQRGAMNLLEVVTQDISLANRIAERGFVRSLVQLVVDAHPDWFQAWCDDHVAKVERDPDGVHFACDTEFLEKSGGVDESEVTSWSAQSPITRINGANDRVTGWTVPYKQPYIGIFDRMLQRLRALGAWVWFWNKYADVDHLRAAGHALEGLQMIDAMWLWHHIQSDLPRGLGFVAPMASDFGPWKHWGKDKAKEGPYAAADGVQTWRTAMWLLSAAQRMGMFDLFMRDWHERDQYCLRPAFEMGVPVDRQELQTFHEELQRKLASVLERIKQTAAQGVLKPKLGYAKQPKGKACLSCDGEGDASVTAANATGNCPACGGGGTILKPPASILGKPKKGGGEAKTQYMTEGVTLVEREIEIEVNTCTTCGAVDVGGKHKCPLPPRPSKRHRARGDSVDPEPAADAAGADAGRVRPVAALVRQRVRQRRWFWQLPFNPDAPAQILQYLAQQGIEAPIDKKKGRATTNKKALESLKKQHADDPFFQLQMDWKAVQKVDSTYAVGTLSRLDRDDRIHPEFLPKPSTLRDSCVNPNIQNVVADKGGPQGLASGFRRCVVARDGVPPGVTAEELAAWRQRWA